MELLQYSFQLCGNRQAEMGCVLHEGYSFIGQVEENDGGAKYTCRAEDLHIHQVADADQHKYQDLFEDAPEANLRGELLVHDSAHDPGEIVQNHKGQQGVQQAIAAAEEIAEPATNGGEWYSKILS